MPPFVDGAIIILAVLFLYGHTLQVPFYLDDMRGLEDNFRLRDLSASFAQLFSQRGLTNLTFAFNYRFSGWALPPLHLTNIAVHAGCGVLVWQLLRRLLQGRWLPLLGALLFVAHPLQTQGVTYLIQRAAVLGTFFCLLSFLFYLQARETLATGTSRNAQAYLRPYLGAVLAGACAVLAKENAALLPLVLFAYDRLFPLPGQRSFKQMLATYLPFCVVPLLLGATVIIALASRGFSRVFSYQLASLQHNDPLHYLTTQLSVVWIYLRLLILPYGQALEHNYPVVSKLFTVQNGVALAGWLLVGVFLWRFRHRRPLLVFGAIWFFLSLLVESSVIPLDPLFEHRLYLPMFGFILVVIDGLRMVLPERWLVGWMVAALCVCALLTWQRNALWSDPIAFHLENLRVVPDSERAADALATKYEEVGRQEESMRLLERMVVAYPESYFLYGRLATHYAAYGEGEKGLDLLEKGMANRPGYAALYDAAANISKKYGRDLPRAIGYLRRALAVAQVNQGKMLNTLGLYYSEAGAVREAEESYLASLEYPAADGDRASIYMNLAREYYGQQRWSETFTVLQQALQLSPDDPEILGRLGEMALRLGDRETARSVAEKLVYVNREAGQRLLAAMRARGW